MFEANEYHGDGVLTMADGAVFDGLWKNNTLTIGKGSYTDVAGIVWVNGNEDKAKSSKKEASGNDSALAAAGIGIDPTPVSAGGGAGVIRAVVGALKPLL
jgi:hypothetical protein